MTQMSRRFALLASCSIATAALAHQAVGQSTAPATAPTTTPTTTMTPRAAPKAEISFTEVQQALNAILSKEVELSQKDFNVRYSPSDIERIRRRVWDKTQSALSEIYSPREGRSGSDNLAPTSPGIPMASTTTGHFVTKQWPNQWLASKFKGTDVIGVDDKKIGDVSDILFDKDKAVIGYVVGVGGWLGIGAKDVVIDPDSFQLVAGKEANDYKLRLSMTKDELKAAPAFEPFSPPRPVSSQNAPNRPMGAPAPTPAPTKQ